MKYTTAITALFFFTLQTQALHLQLARRSPIPAPPRQPSSRGGATHPTPPQSAGQGPPASSSPSGRSRPGRSGSLSRSSSSESSGSSTSEGSVGPLSDGGERTGRRPRRPFPASNTNHAAMEMVMNGPGISATPGRTGRDNPTQRIVPPNLSNQAIGEDSRKMKMMAAVTPNSSGEPFAKIHATGNAAVATAKTGPLGRGWVVRYDANGNPVKDRKLGPNQKKRIKAVGTEGGEPGTVGAYVADDGKVYGKGYGGQ